MFSKEGIRSLHELTHGCLDRLFSHAAGVPFSVLQQEVPGMGSATICGQLLHVLFTEAAWVCDLQDIPIRKWEAGSFTGFDALWSAKEKVFADTAAYLARLNESELNSELRFRPRDWVGPLRSPAFILCHVVTHAFHHKGQIVTMFRILRHPAPDTDLQRED